MNWIEVMHLNPVFLHYKRCERSCNTNKCTIL